MALKDKHGFDVKVGDKVRTPDGDVVEIQGRIGAGKRREFRMADCEKVARSTPVGDLPPAPGEQLFA